MKDWIMELCPEIQEWQAELIAEHTRKLVEAERQECLQIADYCADANMPASMVANAILARGVK